MTKQRTIVVIGSLRVKMILKIYTNKMNDLQVLNSQHLQQHRLVKWLFDEYLINEYLIITTFYVLHFSHILNSIIQSVVTVSLS